MPAGLVVPPLRKIRSEYRSVISGEFAPHETHSIPTISTDTDELPIVHSEAAVSEHSFDVRLAILRMTGVLLIIQLPSPSAVQLTTTDGSEPPLPSGFQPSTPLRRLVSCPRGLRIEMSRQKQHSLDNKRARLSLLEYLEGGALSLRSPTPSALTIEQT